VSFNRAKYAAPHLAMLVRIHRLELAISAVCIGTVDSVRTHRLGYRLHATRRSDYIEEKGISNTGIHCITNSLWNQLTPRSKAANTLNTRHNIKICAFPHTAPYYVTTISVSIYQGRQWVCIGNGPLGQRCLLCGRNCVIQFL